MRIYSSLNAAGTAITAVQDNNPSQFYIIQDFTKDLSVNTISGDITERSDLFLLFEGVGVGTALLFYHYDGVLLLWHGRASVAF